MNRRYSFRKLTVSSFLGFTTLWMAHRAMACPASDNSCEQRTQESANAKFVEATYRSACGRMPDPASYNYYCNLLDEGTGTRDQVRQAEMASCQETQHADACRHIAGLNDLCGRSTN